MSIASGSPFFGGGAGHPKDGSQAGREAVRVAPPLFSVPPGADRGGVSVCAAFLRSAVSPGPMQRLPTRAAADSSSDIFAAARDATGRGN